MRNSRGHVPIAIPQNLTLPDADFWITQYHQGAVDFNRYAVIEQNSVTQQDSSAQARGQISKGLIAVFRALGGGWEIRLGEAPVAQRASPEAAVPWPPAPEELPTPQPVTPNR